MKIRVRGLKYVHLYCLVSTTVCQCPVKFVELLLTNNMHGDMWFNFFSISNKSVRKIISVLFLKMHLHLIAFCTCLGSSSIYFCLLSLRSSISLRIAWRSFICGLAVLRCSNPLFSFPNPNDFSTTPAATSAFSYWRRLRGRLNSLKWSCSL